MVINRHLSLKLHYKVEWTYANKRAQKTIQNPQHCTVELKKKQLRMIIIFIKSSSYCAKMESLSADHAFNEATRKARKIQMKFSEGS